MISYRKLFLISTAIIGAGVVYGSIFIHKNRNDFDKRLNPADRKSYQFREYVGDADGDGVPDFSINLTVVTPNELRVAVNGISANAAQSIAVSIDGDVFAYQVFNTVISVSHTHGTFGTHNLRCKIKAPSGRESTVVEVPFTIENIIYVSRTGNDTYAGTRLFPIKTIQTAITQAVSRGITQIRIAQGVYTRGNGMIDGVTGGIVITNNNMKLTGGWNDDFSAQTALSELNSEGALRAVFINNATNISFSGFSVYGGYMPTAPGGGIYCSGMHNSVISNVRINNNEAKDGGGIYLTGSRSNIIAGMIYGNRVSGSGGGVHAYQCFSNVYSSVFYGNNADTSGGGLFLYFDTRSIVSGEVYGNHTGVEGGGICLRSSVSNRVSGNVYNNLADMVGGGIAVLGCEGAVLTNMVYDNAANGGGGIFIAQQGESFGGPAIIYPAKYLMVNSFVTRNVAQNQGGGIYAESCHISVIGGSIYSNKGQAGGGVHLGTDTASNLITASVFSNDTACGGGVGCDVGGGVYLSGKTNLVTGPVFLNGGYEGGGIYMMNAEECMIRASVYNNSAQNGIGIAVKAGTNNAISNCYITNNGTASGNVISLNAATNLTIYGSYISGAAGFTGYGIYELYNDTTNHRMVNNTFYTNRMRYLYYDDSTGRVVTNTNGYVNINTESWTGAGYAAGNGVSYY